MMVCYGNRSTTMDDMEREQDTFEQSYLAPMSDLATGNNSVNHDM